MSPSESELRAALHDGEGERPDPDAVIERARTARHQRRVRAGAAAASALAVAGIAVGSVVAVNAGGSGTPAAQSTPGPTRSAASGATQGCPATVPYTSPPAHTSTSGSLFPRPVHSVQVCAYVSGAHSPADIAARLTGRQATGLVLSIEQGTSGAAPGRRVCPMFRVADAHYLVIIGIDADGATMPPVTASAAPNPCNRWITNGSTTRYGWIPPDSVGSLVQPGSAPSSVTRLTPQLSPPPTLNRGSPPR